MKFPPTFAFATLATLLTLLSACSGGDAKSTGQIRESVAFDQNLGAQVDKTLGFVDEDGHPVQLGQFLDKKAVILTPVYYGCPMLCTQVLNGLVDSLKKLSLEPGRDYEIVTFTINPKDEPEIARKKKQAYIERFEKAGVAPYWHFLCADPRNAVAPGAAVTTAIVPLESLAGSDANTAATTPSAAITAEAATTADAAATSTPDATRSKPGATTPPDDTAASIAARTPHNSSIDSLASTIGFHYAYDPSIDQYAHAAGVVVLTPGGKVSKYLYGIDPSPRDLRLAIVDSSAGKVGTIADQLFLWICYHYDPLTGRYSFAVMSIVRALGFLTVIGVVAYLFVHLRRERLVARMQAGG